MHKFNINLFQQQIFFSQHKIILNKKKWYKDRGPKTWSRYNLNRNTTL